MYLLKFVIFTLYFTLCFHIYSCRLIPYKWVSGYMVVIVQMGHNLTNSLLIGNWLPLFFSFQLIIFLQTSLQVYISLCEFFFEAEYIDTLNVTEHCELFFPTKSTSVCYHQQAPVHLTPCGYWQPLLTEQSRQAVFCCFRIFLSEACVHVVGVHVSHVLSFGISGMSVILCRRVLCVQSVLYISPVCRFWTSKTLHCLELT